MSSCNICGGTAFIPGPQGRMARSGKLPRCAGCLSLERHRGLRALLASLPRGFFADRRALQFAPSHSPDRSANPAWFTEYQDYIHTGPERFSLANIRVPSASADFISLSHMLEFEANDLAAFDELCRIASPGAVLHIGFASSLKPPKPPASIPPSHPSAGSGTTAATSPPVSIFKPAASPPLRSRPSTP
jgi:hypothetical protein